MSISHSKISLNYIKADIKNKYWPIYQPWKYIGSPLVKKIVKTNSGIEYTHPHTAGYFETGPLTICFSVYLLELSRLTASMWPKSISWPKRKMKSSLHTYFFLLYPSKALSPLNFERMLANSLFMRLISASLLLPKDRNKKQDFN